MSGNPLPKSLPINGGGNPLPKSLPINGEGLDVLSIHSPSFDPFDGYGRMTLELLHHLDKAGVHVNAMGVPGDEIDFAAHTDHIHWLLTRPIQPSVGGLMLGYPTLRNEYSPLLSAGPTVAITMFESTGLPDGWVESLNQCKAVIVPSTMNADVFRANGVKVPIHVIPLGVSETFHYVDRGIRKPSVRRPYTFVTWGDRGSRKGWDIAAQAFYNAFGDREDVKLVIKSRNFHHQFSKHANIEIIKESFSERELMEFYAGIDCMIFPSRGEGFGLPPREFAATGGHSIVTEWWADDVEQWGYGIRKYKMVKAWSNHPRHDGLGEWAECDVDEVVRLLNHVVTQNPRLMRHMGQRVAGRVRKLYSWERFAERVLEVWRHPTKGAYLDAHYTLAEKRQMRRERKRHGVG